MDIKLKGLSWAKKIHLHTWRNCLGHLFIEVWTSQVLLELVYIWVDSSNVIWTVLFKWVTTWLVQDSKVRSFEHECNTPNTKSRNLNFGSRTHWVIYPISTPTTKHLRRIGNQSLELYYFNNFSLWMYLAMLGHHLNGFRRINCTYFFGLSPTLRISFLMN